MASTQTAPPARLKPRYLEEIRPALIDRFGYSSVMQAPKLEKITVNMGVGLAKTDSKILRAATEQLATIAGQQPSVRRARKSIAAFKLREGNPVGVAVTLRGDRGYEFLDRSGLDRDPPHQRLPRAQPPLLRRPRQLLAGRPRADHLPRDRLRRDRPGPRHRHHHHHLRRLRRRGLRAPPRVRPSLLRRPPPTRIRDPRRRGHRGGRPGSVPPRAGHRRGARGDRRGPAADEAPAAEAEAPTAEEAPAEEADASAAEEAPAAEEAEAPASESEATAAEATAPEQDAAEEPPEVEDAEPQLEAIESEPGAEVAESEDGGSEPQPQAGGQDEAGEDGRRKGRQHKRRAATDGKDLPARQTGAPPEVQNPGLYSLHALRAPACGLQEVRGLPHLSARTGPRRPDPRDDEVLLVGATPREPLQPCR